MKINNFQGELTDVSAHKEAQIITNDNAAFLYEALHPDS